MKPVWINMDEHEALGYLEGTYTPRTSSVLDPETVIEDQPERPQNEAPDLSTGDDYRGGTVLYGQDARDWKAMQKLIRVTGWHGLDVSGSQIGFGILKTQRAWYIEMVEFKGKPVTLPARPVVKRGTTLEEAILKVVDLNPDLLRAWNAD